MIKFFKKKEPTGTESFVHAAKIASAVQEAQIQGIIRLEEGEVFLFKELWPNKKTAETWMKNLFFYCRMFRNHPTNQALFFKDMESGEAVGKFDGKKAILMKKLK